MSTPRITLLLAALGLATATACVETGLTPMADGTAPVDAPPSAQSATSGEEELDTGEDEELEDSGTDEDEDMDDSGYDDDDDEDEDDDDDDDDDEHDDDEHDEHDEDED